MKTFIDDGFGEGVVSCTTIYIWYKWFKNGMHSLEDNERTGWLTAVIDENEARVHVLLMKDHHMSIQILADELNMGKDSVALVLKEKNAP